MADDIEFDGVTLERGGKTVLSHLNLRLSERRIGLVGSNGSGKSSFAGLINGLLQPSQGSVRVFGLDTVKDRSELPSTIGYIFQNPDHQIVFPSVREEIAFSLEMSGRPRKEARTEATAFLNQQGLSDWCERPVHTLSEGQKQWLCILAVLIMEPRTLIFDEPFASLDLATRTHLLRRIEQLPQNVIMISHDLAVLEGYDRAIWLADGAVHQDGNPDQVIAAFKDAAVATADTLLC